MSLGPILIFDKSALQALSVDEAVWMDNFFLSNITPLFYIETLADLEKGIARGRTPEQVVGNLAYKTPDMQSYPAVHHDTLLASELAGIQKVAMDGRIMRAGGRPVALNGKKGVLYSRSPEEEAFERWAKGEFLDIERQIAKAWRRNLTGLDYKEIYRALQARFRSGKPKSLAAVKALVDSDIDQDDQAQALRLGMSVLCLPSEAQGQVMKRWEDAGKPSIREFAPYFTHMFSVDFFFYLAIAADLVGTDRPSNKVDNKVDLAYLYYLPFCMVFTSSDNLHARIVPLFLRQDQSFVKGQELKVDLLLLDQHYAAMPDETKASGFFQFASAPPVDDSFLVTRLWDKYLPKWRRKDEPTPPLSPKAEQELVKQLNRVSDESVTLHPSEYPNADGVEFVQVQRTVLPKKGKWQRISLSAIKRAAQGNH